MPKTTFMIKCLCGNVTTKLSPLLGLEHNPYPPLNFEICYCDTCRHSSGAFGATLIHIQNSPPSDVIAQCAVYESAKHKRYFCRQCGSHLFLQYFNPDNSDGWMLWAGVIERSFGGTQGFLNVTMHAFVENTKDGGFPGRIAEVALAAGSKSGDGKSYSDLLAKVYAGMWEGQTMQLSEIAALSSSTAKSAMADASKKLEVKCHCGSIAFQVTRPDPANTYPDEAHFYLKSNNTKYLARLCTCRSCCKATGTPMQAWTYVPPSNILTSSGKAITFGTSEGSLSELPGVKKFRREAVTRSFCGTCGATVFYECADREWVVDVSVGILRAGSGSMAKEFLEWDWKDTSWREECVATGMLKGLIGEDM